MTVDLNRLILGKSYNSTKVFRTAQHVVQAILLGVVVPALILLLIWDLTDKDRKSTRLNSSHLEQSRMPSSA